MFLLWYLDMFLSIWLKSKILDAVSLRKVLGFSYEQNTIGNCFAMKELCHMFTWKISKVLLEFSRVNFHKSPRWLLLKVLQQIRPCSKSATKNRVKLYQLLLIGCLYKYLGTTEYAFSKTSCLSSIQHIGSWFRWVCCRSQNTL